MEAVESLRSRLDCLACSYELIVADDCSSAGHSATIDSIPNARVVRTPRNSGLGANANNGLTSATGELILQIQDDWECNVDHSVLNSALAFIRANEDIGIVQLTPVGTDLPTERRSLDGQFFRVFQNDRLPWMRRCGVRPYSDQPHLKRAEFVRDVGPYLEGVPMTIGENEYKRRVAGQARWKVAMTEGAPCFDHAGADSSLNPGGRRHPIVNALHRLPGGETIIEPLLRRLAHGVDHFAATLMAVR
jgi:GT2 family glycosyltransferase